MIYHELSQDLSKLNLLYVKEQKNTVLKYYSPDIDFPLTYKGFETIVEWFKKVLKYHDGTWNT